LLVSFEFVPLGLREMPAPPRKYRLGAQQRLALQFLAGSPFGATDAAMLVNGFHRQMLVRLIRTGLATTERDITSLSAASGSLRRVAGRSKVIEHGPVSHPYEGTHRCGRR
jgi:hypothetical protein